MGEEKGWHVIPGNKCLISVDGTDCPIYEPTPWSSKWYSHKFEGPGVRYEIAISIQTGWIVWLNGPFPCGDWPDIRIARTCLNHHLDDGEYYLADGGYGDNYQYAVTPRGLWKFGDRQIQVVRARHETVNSRIKIWRALSSKWRHELDKHGMMMRAVVLVVQLGLETDEPLFSVDYDETEF